MKRLLAGLAVIAICSAFSSQVAANVVTLQFDANDIFTYATADDTRLNQLGTARFVHGTDADPIPTGRAYRTYNDATRDSGATAEQDLQSVANIIDWTAAAGYQGMSHVQLWLLGGDIVRGWGEKILAKDINAVTASVNGEYDWSGYVSEGYIHYNTVLGGEGHQNAISPDYNPAEQVWTITGDFYVDVDGSDSFTAGDTDLVLGEGYAIWFNAALNNWHCVDDYGNDAWGHPDIEGSLIATVVPEPSTSALLIIGGLSALAAAWFRKRSS
ncbi:MAG: PEP-CTERM sorting domain-containing protein [Pirellulales bacterium]|nr:PEP-CTERM sorting domain-containing protein [Pirellulales bacterium]